MGIVKLSLSSVIILLLSFIFAVILVVMSYYDDSYDYSIGAAIKGQATTNVTPPFSSRIGALITVLAIALITWLFIRSKK
jgi:hypothetical protein